MSAFAEWALVMESGPKSLTLNGDGLADLAALLRRAERLEAALTDIAACPDGGCATCNEEAKMALAEPAGDAPGTREEG